MTKDKSGNGVGLYNSFFNAGAAIGFVSLAFADVYIGWRVSLELLGFISMAAALLLIPRKIKKEIPVNDSENAQLPDESIAALLVVISVSLVLASITEAVVGQLFVYYSVTELKVDLSVASTSFSTYWIAGIFGALLFGRFSQLFLKSKIYFIVPVLMLALSYVIVSFIEGALELILISITMGFLSNGILSILYLSVIRMTYNSDKTPVYLGANNFIQKIIALGTPSLFAILSVLYSFRVSWMALALIGIVPSLSLLLIRRFPHL